MSWAQVHAFSRGLDLVLPASDPAPSFNVAPTQPAWTLVADVGGARAEAMRWGLVPAWKARRCLVPASGYYEWREEAGVKQPYYIHDGEAPVLMFAGLWERWKSPAGEWIHSFAIVTCAALDPMRQLHDRTPLMLPAPVLHDWLHGTPEAAAAIALAVEPPPLRWHAVSRAVGNPRSNGPQLVAPIPLGS